MSLFNNFVQFKQEAKSSLKNAQDVFKDINNHSADKMIDVFLKDFDSQRYNLTITGSMNRGKSTLLNECEQMGK